MRGSAAFPASDMHGVSVVTAPPEIDISNAEDLRAALLAAAAAHRIVVADLSSTEFCDSRAIHALLRASDRLARDGGELRLVVTTEPVARVLSLLGADRILAVYASVIEASRASR